MDHKFTFFLINLDKLNVSLDLTNEYDVKYHPFALHRIIDINFFSTLSPRQVMAELAK